MNDIITRGGETRRPSQPGINANIILKPRFEFLTGGAQFQNEWMCDIWLQYALNCSQGVHT
jgi:hypothetical protein